MDRDYSRWREIVKGKIRKDLRRYIGRRDLIGQRGRQPIVIPVSEADVPTFRYGPNDTGGVGSGDGNVGDYIGKGQQQGAGKAQGGTEPGRHMLIDTTLEELGDVLFKDTLKLPPLQPKGKQRIVAHKLRFKGVRRTGPMSALLRKKTFLRALKEGLDLPNNPTPQHITDALRKVPIWDPRFRVFRSCENLPVLDADACIIYVMDVSGSMGEEQRAIAYVVLMWIREWIRRNYKGITERYILYDTEAKEVSEEIFHKVKEDGGTRISSAYKKLAHIVKEESVDRNVYVFHFTDGDNSSKPDTVNCMAILRTQILPLVNLFGYCQVVSAYGSGEFINELLSYIPLNTALDVSLRQKVRVSKANSLESVMDVLDDFFGEKIPILQRT